MFIVRKCQLVVERRGTPSGGNWRRLGALSSEENKQNVTLTHTRLDNQPPQPNPRGRPKDAFIIRDGRMVRQQKQQEHKQFLAAGNAADKA